MLFSLGEGDHHIFRSEDCDIRQGVIPAEPPFHQDHDRPNLRGISMGNTYEIGFK
jgi:hypothetical protein